MISTKILAVALVAVAGSTVSAGTIGIADIGGGLVLTSRPDNGTMLGHSEPAWSSASVAAIHAAVNADGIVTNGRITFLAADTDNGLTLMALIDEELVPLEAATAGTVHVDSVADGANLAFLKDSGASVTIGASGPNARIMSGNFQWNSNGGGDAFAWAGLIPGNTVTYRFNTVDTEPLGLDNPSTFQFVTWTGTAWARVNVPADQLSFSASSDYGFAATVLTPAPSTVLLAGGPLLGLSLVRRRSAR